MAEGTEGGHANNPQLPLTDGAKVCPLLGPWKGAEPRDWQQRKRDRIGGRGQGYLSPGLAFGYCQDPPPPSHQLAFPKSSQD